MYKFLFLSSGGSITAESGVHKIETSRGIIRIDVKEDGILIPFSAKRIKSLFYTQQETEIDLLKAYQDEEDVVVATITVEEKWIISEDEVLIIYDLWPIYALVTSVELPDEFNRN